MKFLTDQDVYLLTIDYLRKSGHDVITAGELNMQRATDHELLQKAKSIKRLFVTRDKDFGALVFLKKKISPGIILLGGKPSDIKAVHSELSELLTKINEDEPHGCFCVVDRNSFRIRRIE